MLFRLVLRSCGRHTSFEGVVPAILDVEYRRRNAEEDVVKPLADEFNALVVVVDANLFTRVALPQLAVLIERTFFA